MVFWVCFQDYFTK